MRKTAAAMVLTLGSLLGTAARGQTFPGTYAPLYCHRGFMVDGYRDESGAVDDRDIVGSVDRPAGLRAVDAQFLYLRMRVDASPVQGNGLTQFAWGFELSTDGMLAVCIQHEMDHLIGKVFVDYLSPLKRARLMARLRKKQRLAG